MKRYNLPSLLGNHRLKTAVSDFPGGTGSVILDGPAGCGKHTAAFDIAMGLFCQAAGDVPCGVCPACLRMKAGTHPDYHVLRFDGKAVKVEEVRAIRAQSFIQPSEAEFKIILIENGDKLSIQAQNVLLKVLEEPLNTQFIILCDNREAMLQTVRSRCVTFRLEPLDTATLTRALKDMGHHPKDIERALPASDGYLGQALEFLSGEEPRWRGLARDFVLTVDQDELSLYTLCLELGKLSREDYAAFCDAACTGLLARAKATPLPRYFAIFEAIEAQMELMPSNPSPLGLAGALAAACANLVNC